MASRQRLIRWIFDDVWSRGKVDRVPDRIGRFTFHYGGMARELDGMDLARLVLGWRDGFPDLTFELLDLVEQGNLMAARCQLRGTHRGMWRGIGATGHQIAMDAMFFFRFEGNNLVEVWEVDDAMGRQRQLGLL
jgi:predicted ester cyclase